MATKVPKYFYKYRPMHTEVDTDRVRQIVLGNQLYFANAGSFNDPFDMFPVMSLDASPAMQREDFIRMARIHDAHLTDAQREILADKVMSTSLATPDDVKFAQQQIQFFTREYLSNNIATYCVSEVADNLLMWAHYANSHSGICLEFDGYSKLMAQAQPIQYAQKREPINHYFTNKGASATKALLTKSMHWEYECEWRLLVPDSGPCTMGIRPDTLTGIVIGAMAKRETVELVKEWNGKRSIPLKLRKARTSNDQFELIIEDLR